MGFGERTDFESQRKLDLDKSYEYIIKPTVEDARLVCIRADKDARTGILDKKMYALLHSADLVIADLSTANPNAIYELGVRHALRPRGTIVMAESDFSFPFNLNHLHILKYEHLGKGIDHGEVERVKGVLATLIQDAMRGSEADSPVFHFLDIEPPEPTPVPDMAAATEAPARSNSLVQLARQAKDGEDWSMARSLLQEARKKYPQDPFVLQQLALATYKLKVPDEVTALREAREVLRELSPQRSKDPETLGIWGAIHKGLWDNTHAEHHLETSLTSYRRGFDLKDDYYNGINYAFLLNARASVTQGRQAVQDFLRAEEVRREVIEICFRKLRDGVRDGEGKEDLEEGFWIQATLVEAYVGLGADPSLEQAVEAVALSLAPQPWMKDSLYQQLGKLRPFLEASPLKVQAIPLPPADPPKVPRWFLERKADPS